MCMTKKIWLRGTQSSRQHALIGTRIISYNQKLLVSAYCIASLGGGGGGVLRFISDGDVRMW